ncbi:MAG: thioredoxin family protein [Flavobacteriales bacterium]
MENFKSLVHSHPFVLVDFFATWCEPCKVLDVILQDVSNHFGNELKIIKIDIEKNEAIAKAYELKSVPILHLYKDGDLIWKYKGFMNTTDTIKTLETYKSLKKFKT